MGVGVVERFDRIIVLGLFCSLDFRHSPGSVSWKFRWFFGPGKLFWVCRIYIQDESFNNFDNDTTKLSVNEAKSTGLWARNYATIQQGLILKFAFGPKSFRAFGDVGSLVSFLPEERGPISRAEQRLVIAPSYLTVYELLQVPHILESFFFLISEHDVAFPRHHEFVQPVLHQIHFPPTGTTSWQSDHQSSVSCK